MVETKIIHMSGTDIGELEERYVLDAVRNSSGPRCYEYIERFEEAFARYVDTRYAISTSSGTGAIHLALAACGIGPGDEVIIPDLGFIAAASPVVWLGAIPVFCDVERDTWCIDPQSARSRITSRTKAILPVHMYGGMSDMDGVRDVAYEYGLQTVEDACPSVGVFYGNAHAGTLGEVGAFSFQGAKIMITGQGGMLVTSDEEVHRRALKISQHGADQSRKFWYDQIGYKYYMSNIEAALGLAQLERIEEFLAKKREIFGWYHKRLGNVPGIAMNVERPGTHVNYWMTSIVIDNRFGVTRGELTEGLKERSIETRPFFYPMSEFPMFEDADTPVAHSVSRGGINLPSGVFITEEEVDRVSSAVLDILEGNHERT